MRAAHPYALPEWLVVDVGGGQDYLAWITESVAVVSDARLAECLRQIVD